MAQAITRLFDSHEDAAAAVRDLEQAGIPDKDISLIANNTEGRWGRRDSDDDRENDAAKGAAKGAATGGLLGGGAGLLAGLGMLAIPGLGPVVAAGWLASTAVGAIGGALAGGAAGGLLGALMDAGHSDEEAQVYAEGVRRGGTLVSVKPSNAEDANRVEQILMTDGGVDAGQRGAMYREAGWVRFDEQAEPYSADQIAAERTRYRESRSFQSRGDMGEREADEPMRTDPRSRPIEPPPRDI
jgi:hypothetical protein